MPSILVLCAGGGDGAGGDDSGDGDSETGFGLDYI